MLRKAWGGASDQCQMQRPFNVGWDNMQVRCSLNSAVLRPPCSMDVAVSAIRTIRTLQKTPSIKHKPNHALVNGVDFCSEFQDCMVG